MVLMIARFRRQRSSATTISAWIHCRFSVNMLRMKRENMVLIQASYRQWKYHRLFLRKRHCYSTSHTNGVGKNAFTEATQRCHSYQFLVT